jgi:hypothetical protein
MVGENWDLKLVKPQLYNQTWKFIQTIGHLSNLNWIINLVWKFIQIGKNWEALVKPQLDNQTWGNIQSVGKNWDLALVKPQLDNQTWFGNSSKQEKIGIWHLSNLNWMI